MRLAAPSRQASDLGGAGDGAPGVVAEDEVEVKTGEISADAPGRLDQGGVSLLLKRSRSVGGFHEGSSG